MDIRFYLNTEEATEIVVFYDLESNPFKLGDEIHLRIDMFNRKTIKLVREGKYVSFKVAQTPKLTIEYHCEIILNK